MQLSEHFSLEEMLFSSTAVRLGIENEPTLAIVADLKVLAQSLEGVRELLGEPMHIDSGYRCLALNKEIGGRAELGAYGWLCSALYLPGIRPAAGYRQADRGIWSGVRSAHPGRHLGAYQLCARDAPGSL